LGLRPKLKVENHAGRTVLIQTRKVIYNKDVVNYRELLSQNQSIPHLN